MASATAFTAPGAGGASSGRGPRPCAVAAATAPATASAAVAVSLGVAAPASAPGRRSSASGGAAGSTSATISSANKSRGGTVSTGLRPGRIVRKKTATQQVVQWKTRNVQEGIVLVDETQLSRLIKRDPIDKFYDMDPEPFATGMFASVRRCRSRDTGIQLAAKFSSRLRYGADCSAEIHHEIALLSLCSPSPRVIKLHDVFQTDAEIILVMEYAPGGDLQTLIDDNIVPYESDVVTFTRQLVEGLAYLHQRKIAHLDIKPQNLVMMGDFPDCDVKLCDFEISRVILEGTEIREILGTPDYVAPEILHYEPITMAADLWSLGVTVYVLLTGFSPFGGETDQETFCNISRAQLDFPEELFEDVSAEAQDFIRRLLQRDPRSRPTAKECLRHPWLSQRSADGGAGRSRSCASCSSAPSAPNLRKYLSKSREALFERVLQRGGGAGGLLGTARAARAGPGGRLCESQMSLVSKSRERELQAALVAMSPSLSRSREKLYGLRSLSRSQEVLAMCRALPVLRTLTRATTADLSELGVGPGAVAPRVRLHTSVGSELDTLPDLEDESEPLSGSFSTPATPAPTATATQPPLLERATSTPATTGAATPAVATPTTFTATSTVTLATPSRASATAAVSTPDKALPSPTSELETTPALASDLPLNTASAATSTTSPAPATPTAPPATPQASASTEPPAVPASESAVAPAPAAAADVEAEAEAILNALRRGLLARGSPALPALLAPLMVAAATSNNPASVVANGLASASADNHLDAEPPATAPALGLTVAAGTAGLQREQSTLSSHSESSESTLEGDDDGQGLNDEDLNEDELQDDDSDTEQQAQQQVQQQEQGEQGEQQEQEEPRFTVQQLITAYNLHDEVVTKSSLDFTMATKATDREVKLPAPLSNGGENNKSKFPTGPNALRLFIPDIDITNAKPRKAKAKTSKLTSTALAASIDKIDEEELDGEQQTQARLSPDTINNNNINSHINNNIGNSSILASSAKLVIRVDDMSEPVSTPTPATASSAPSDPPEPPPPPPPPPASLLEPKKSPKSGRPSTALAPTPPASTTTPSLSRHRRSASTPNSEPYSRSAGVSPSPSPSKAGAARGASGSNGVGVHRSSSGAGSGTGRKSSSSALGTGNAHGASEKLRRKSTPVFK